MPISFASILGGMVTLIGTPPNILISEALRQAGLKPFEMFELWGIARKSVLAVSQVGVFAGNAGQLPAHTALVRLLAERRIARNYLAVCGGVLTGGRCVFLDSTDPSDICRTIEREKVSTVVWVPTLARRLVEFERLSDYNLSSLKKMHCGGGASLAVMIQDVRDKLGCRFYNGYGATEGQTALTRSDDDFETVKATVGRPTCPHDSYKVVDWEAKELLPNTCGELVIKGPGVFTGYYKNFAENEKVFLPDGFFRTGDVARIDKKGCIRLCGRLKEMIDRKSVV